MESTVGPLDINVEIKKFISANARSSQIINSHEITEAALKLLKSVPAVRDAVLEHFCSIFSIAVTKHLRHLEVSVKTFL